MSVSILDLAAYKARGEKFVMLTAYDFPTAQILDEAGVPVLLVGDSLAQVVLGYDTTIPVSVDEMLHHTRAVARGARNALIVGDMPFGTYGGSVERGIENAIRFMKEGSAHAVKFEGPQMDLVEQLARIGVPVMAHLGLTPQSVHLFGGYKVQGRSEEQAENIVRWAKELEEAVDDGESGEPPQQAAEWRERCVSMSAHECLHNDWIRPLHRDDLVARVRAAPQPLEQVPTASCLVEWTVMAFHRVMLVVAHRL